MLRRLHIRNYALIDELDIICSDHLTIITGETGAGKSILLGALGLIMGKRADTKVLYIADKKCFVEAIFDISAYDMRSYFEQEELDYSDDLIIRREIAANGKRRAFINDSPVTLEILSSITNALIDIHQQFDTLDIQKPSFQLQMIDAIAGNQSLLFTYSELYRQYKIAVRELEELILRSKNANQEMEFLAFQMGEFEDANLKENEQSNLESLLIRLTAAEDIKKNSALLVQGIEEDNYSVLGQLQILANQIGTIRQYDVKIQDLYERLVSIKEELSDISREASKIADATEYDEEAIEQTNARLSLIYRMQKKHHVADMSGLIQTAESIKKRLASFSDISDKILALEKDIRNKETELKNLSDIISANRMSIIPTFEKNIHDKLVTLAMDNAYIRVKCEKIY